MTFVKSTLAVAALSAALTASAASAATSVTTADCVKLSGEVATAIDANQASANLKQAKDERSAGNYYCGSGMFAKGVEHYNQALTLLGGSGDKMSQH